MRLDGALAVGFAASLGAASCSTGEDCTDRAAPEPPAVTTRIQVDLPARAGTCPADGEGRLTYRPGDVYDLTSADGAPVTDGGYGFIPSAFKYLWKPGEAPSAELCGILCCPDWSYQLHGCFSFTVVGCTVTSDAKALAPTCAPSVIDCSTRFGSACGL